MLSESTSPQLMFSGPLKWEVGSRNDVIFGLCAFKLSNVENLDASTFFFVMRDVYLPRQYDYAD